MEKAVESIYSILAKIQAELRVEKKRLNKFANYNYRNLDDIFEAFKPFAKKYGVSLIINDEIVVIGDGLFLKATASLCNSNGEKVETTAFAKHSNLKKGFDEAQLTGMTSSYARKYALNALFVLDDAVDIDSTNGDDCLDNAKIETLRALIKATNTDEANLLKYFKVKSLDKVNYDICHKMLLEKQARLQNA